MNAHMAAAEHRIGLASLFWPLRWRYACGCKGEGRCVGGDAADARDLVVARATRVCLNCEILATADVLHRWLQERFSPRAPFLLQRYNTRALGLGLTVEETRRVAVAASKLERAADVTS